MDTHIIEALVIATVLGFVLGLERSLAGKHAGMRTYALVSLGSCLFTIVGVTASYQLAVFVGINPLQIASSIVVGIGFIGAGLAVVRGDNQSNHVELTTAAGIWVAAAIGMASGFSMYTVAVATTILAILVFSVFARIEHAIRVRFGSREHTS
ncbi:MAG: MgtC/SapB family protein [Patescibacteria group bacterium]|nr:MgtC/SapB family protein [Patescibacteria group bacterium]